LSLKTGKINKRFVKKVLKELQDLTPAFFK